MVSNKMGVPTPSKKDQMEIASDLIELVKEGVVFATRGFSGTLIFHHTANGGADQALPKQDVIRELNAWLN